MSESVPAGWENVTLGEFCVGIRGVSYKPSDLSSNSTIETITLLRSNNIQDTGIVLDDVQHVSCSRVNEQQKAQQNDIAVCMSNGSKRLVGKSASFRNMPRLGNYTVGAFCSIFRSHKNVIPEFVLQLFHSQDYISQVGLSLAGSAINNLKNSDVEDYCFLKPPLPEQQKIASILTSIDTVIEKTEAQINKLKDLKKAMMQELLTKGIGHTEFKDSTVGRIPKGWGVKTFGEVVKSIKSGLSRRIVPQDIGIPVLISGNIQDGKLDTSALKYWYVDDPQGANTNNYLLNDGDILLCFINSISQIGKSCIYHDIGRPAIYTTNMFRVIPKSDYPSDFLHLIMNADSFQREIELITKPAVNQASFTKVDLEAIEVVCPSVNEIKEITNAVLSIGINIDKNQRKLNHTKSLKKALMQDLLTGKVRVKV
jgi:type I restriction enzyme, S subunit